MIFINVLDIKVTPTYTEIAREYLGPNATEGEIIRLRNGLERMAVVALYERTNSAAAS